MLVTTTEQPAFIAASASSCMCFITARCRAGPEYSAENSDVKVSKTTSRGPMSRIFLTAFAWSSVLSALTNTIFSSVLCEPDIWTTRSGLNVVQISGSQSTRSEEHTSELQSQSNLVCRL